MHLLATAIATVDTLGAHPAHDPFRDHGDQPVGSGDHIIVDAGKQREDGHQTEWVIDRTIAAERLGEATVYEAAEGRGL